MSRWIKHWQALPVRNRVCGTLSLAVMIASLIALALYIAALARAEPEAPRTPAVSAPRLSLP